MEADFVRFYGRPPLEWSWRQFVNLFSSMPSESTFTAWYSTVTAEEGGRIHSWQQQMADHDGLAHYTNPNRVISFDQFRGSSLQEDILGSDD